MFIMLRLSGLGLKDGFKLYSKMKARHFLISVVVCRTVYELPVRMSIKLSVVKVDEFIRIDECLPGSQIV